MRHPFALLACSYGLALGGGMALGVAGAGWLAALLTVWLGGAVATLALAATPGLRRVFRDGADDGAGRGAGSDAMRRRAPDRRNKRRPVGPVRAQG